MAVGSIIGSCCRAFPSSPPQQTHPEPGERGDGPDSPMVLSRFTFQVRGPSWSIFLFVRSRFCYQGKGKKMKFLWKQVMIKHRNARGWRQAAKPRLGKETRSREPKILLRDAGYHSSSSTALFHRPSVTGWRIHPPNQPPGALGCHPFPRRNFFPIPHIQLQHYNWLKLQHSICKSSVPTNDLQIIPTI